MPPRVKDVWVWFADRIGHGNETGLEVKFTAVVGRKFLAGTFKFRMQFPGGLERTVAAVETVPGMASLAAADHILLRQRFAAHIISCKNRVADLAEMFGALRIVGLHIKPAVPQRFFAQLQNILLIPAVNHRAETSVANRQRLDPPFRRLLPEKFHILFSVHSLCNHHTLSPRDSVLIILSQTGISVTNTL